ncbi:hypothetical protein [Chishuiella sp.]|uniref:hypothetical protein n=1 Tax=Chishuiella sp. TaxID=1969467 RepID=UPI0028A6D397|nr:hypothetical protein [Chishuiella sp.]
MKKNNKAIISIFKILNLLIICLIIINIILFSNILLDKYHLFPAYYLTIFIILLIWITSANGNQFYDIDTKGETITFETERLDLLSIFNSNKKKIDLPKYKLIKYDYKGGLLSKQITVFIKSKKSQNLTKVKFKLAFISNKNIKLILNKLDEIIEYNKLYENREV